MFILDESSDEDTPLEDEEFLVKHQEWIDSVMKDEMTFTVCAMRQSHMCR